MNSLSSLSFLNSSQPMTGAGAGGISSVNNDAAAANMTNADNTDSSASEHDFDRLLNQSGGQQSANRQSFAGFDPATKTKLMATLPADKTDRGEITLPPIILPETELTDADEHHAVTLLGMLQQAGIATKQLAAQADKQIDKLVETVEVVSDKKGEKGKWFILPIYPEMAEATIADGKALSSNTGATQVTENTAISDDVAAKESSAVQQNRQSTSFEQLTAKQMLEIGEKGAVGLIKPELTGQAVAAQSISKTSIAKTSSENVLATELVIDVDKAPSTLPDMTKHTELQTTISVKAPSSMAQTASEQTASKVLTKAQSKAENTTEPGEITPSANEVSLSANEMATIVGTVNSTKQTASAETKVVTAVDAESAKQNSFTDQPPSASTILGNTGTATELHNNASGVLASNPAAGVVMSESALAKQQLKTNLADAGSVAKALDTANPKEGDGASKMDPAMTAAGQRIETSVSGFANVFSSAASSSPAETTAARLESANMVGAQQLANQVKDTHSKPSVTEQLKQVNLLAQDAAGQLKERVNLMVRQNIQVAEIRLDPADLGKMQIRVNLQQEQATVQFIVQQQNAKELLEQQMPRLREMLQQQGIQLGEGQVQHQRQGDSQAGGQRSGNAGSGQRGGEQLADGQATAVQLDVKLSDRIVDYYA